MSAAAFRQHTLQASHSGTFLQILPELVTPLKGHSLSLRICLYALTLSAPSERFGYCGNNMVSKHARKTWGSRIKKEKEKRVRLDSNDFRFICDGVSNMDGYKRNSWYSLSCLLKTYCYLNTNEKLSVRWQFLEPYGVTSCVVNQCLEFVDSVQVFPQENVVRSR